CGCNGQQRLFNCHSQRKYLDNTFRPSKSPRIPPWSRYRCSVPRGTYSVPCPVDPISPDTACWYIVNRSHCSAAVLPPGISQLRRQMYGTPNQNHFWLPYCMRRCSCLSSPEWRSDTSVHPSHTSVPSHLSPIFHL